MAGTLRSWWEAQKQRANYGEFAQALLRVGLGVLLALGYFPWLEWDPHTWVWSLSLGFVAYSMAIFLWVYRTKKSPGFLRYLTLAVDMGVATALLGLTGERSAVLLFLYTWMALGHGFRYGLKELYVAWFAGLLAFVLVYALSAAVQGFWYRYPLVWLGAFVWVVTPTFYVSYLLKQVAARMAEEARVQVERAQAVAERAEAERARAEAEAASEAKSEFLATMSHEMRTPLNGVVGAAELLAGKDLPQKERQLVDWLLASSRQLRSLIDNLLDLRKIEAGKMVIEPVPFDLHALMGGVAALFEPEAKRARLEFTQSVAADVPSLLVGDDARIQQVLINLVGNALKFTERGFVRVGVKVSERNDHEVSLRFEVRDTGIGIPPEDAGRIFERFTQASPGIHRQYGGSGLGTTICKHLVELMGGMIGFDSRPESGTTFWFTVRLGLRPAGNVASPQPPADSWEAPAATGLRVLVAEDNRISQEIIAMMLRAGGHHVTVASDGEGVLERYRNALFDVVVLDMHMPGRTGLEVAREIRRVEATERGQHMPIIMLTAAASTDLREDSIDAGIDLFLSKPVDPRGLLRGVSQVVSAEKRALPAPAPGEEEYVDRALLREMAGVAGDSDLIRTLSYKFAGEAAQLVEEMDDAVRRSDLRQFHDLAHALKGAAMMTGAVRLRERVARLEKLAASDFGGVSAAMIEDLRGTLVATNRALSRVVP